MARAYLRLDPMFFERKVMDQGYPAGAATALVGVFCLAEHQPERGRFRNERLLKALLADYAKWVPYLLQHGDIVETADGRIYPPGWDEWQEGDWKVGERLDRIKKRRGDASPRSSGAKRTAAWRLRKTILERDHETCRYCGNDHYERDWLVLDHVIPDGPTDEENLVTACRPCNKLKGGRTPDEAGMPLLQPGETRHIDTSRDASVDVSPDSVRDASPNESLAYVTQLDSVIDSASAGGSDSPQPPAGGGRPSRANGTSPRALAKADADRVEAESAARRYRANQRHLAYVRGAITETQLADMNGRDASLAEIPDREAHLASLRANDEPVWATDDPVEAL